MSREFRDRVQDTTTTTGTGPFTLDAATIAGFRTFGGAHTVGATLDYFASLGSDWEAGLGTLTDATHLARTTILASSNAGNVVNFGAGSKAIFETVAAASIAKFLTAADGVDVTTLTAAGTIADADSVLVIQGGTLKLATAAVMKAYYGAGSTSSSVAPGQVTGLAAGTTTDTTQVLSWTAPSTGTAPFTYKVERSVAGANTWTVAAAAASASPYTVTGLTASTSYDYRVSATNTVSTGAVSATVTKSTVAASATPVQTIAVNNPGPQTVGVTYTASGTYANGTPTALDFSVDGGTNWTAVPSPTIGGGNFSFPSTPSTASASRNMMVRDHTTLVSGTSTAYVVNAAAAQTDAQKYSVTVGVNYATTATFSGGTAPNQYWQTGFNLYVKAADNSYPADGTIRFAWGKDPNTCPATFSAGAWSTSVPFSANGGNSGTVPNSVKPSVSVNPATYPGLLAPNATLYGGGSGGNFYPCVLFADGSWKSFGTPVAVS